VRQWVDYLATGKLWGPDDPLFPATQVALGETRQFEASGIALTHWSNVGPIRAIFREAFERAGIPYANPHSFRATLAGLGEKRCRTPEEFKAWSQNMGHEGVMTTFTSTVRFPESDRRTSSDRSLIPKNELIRLQRLRRYSKPLSRLSGILVVRHEIDEGRHPGLWRRRGRSSPPRAKASRRRQQWRLR
jgi:hypothetical protein